MVLLVSSERTLSGGDYTQHGRCCRTKQSQTNFYPGQSLREYGSRSFDLTTGKLIRNVIEELKKYQENIAIMDQTTGSSLTSGIQRKD